MPTKALVMMSGGLSSFEAAARAAQRYGADHVRGLFTDTRIEDPDLYRFLAESAAALAIDVARIEDGRDPWQVFRDERYLGNTRADPCSRILKRELARQWVDAHVSPDTVLVFGLGWDETHRHAAVVENWKPYQVWMPLAEEPYATRATMSARARSLGVEPPALYALGFQHNNCGGFCIKQGQAGFANLLRHFPERYAEHERKEEALRKYLGKDVSILRDRRGGTTKPMTLKTFRERVTRGDLYDRFDWGGCGCFL